MREMSSMSTGIILCFLGAFSFGVAACLSKVAERQNCKASSIVVSLFGWATVLMLARTLALGKGFQMPLKVFGMAVAFGICSAVAFFAFQTSISIGKVTVAWLVMNLSAGVPALVSIWLYKERLTAVKCLALAVALVALLCLFQGNKAEGLKPKLPGPKGE